MTTNATASAILYDVARGELPPGDTTRCGNRTDLSKSQRVHPYTLLGVDVRNAGVVGFIYGNVRACKRCGADKFSAWRGPKLEAVAPYTPWGYGVPRKQRTRKNLLRIMTGEDE